MHCVCCRSNVSLSDYPKVSESLPTVRSVLDVLNAGVTGCV